MHAVKVGNTLYFEETKNQKKIKNYKNLLCCRNIRENCQEEKLISNNLNVHFKKKWSLDMFNLPRKHDQTSYLVMETKTYLKLIFQKCDQNMRLDLYTSWSYVALAKVNGLYSLSTKIVVLQNKWRIELRMYFCSEIDLVWNLESWVVCLRYPTPLS